MTSRLSRFGENRLFLITYLFLKLIKINKKRIIVFKSCIKYIVL